MKHFSDRLLFLDIETTGLKSGINRIIELGIVETIDGQFTGNNLHFYFKSNKPVEPQALAVHGLTDEFLSDKQPFSSHIEEILEYIKNSHAIIIHNARFDVSFLSCELQECGYPALPYLCRSIKDNLRLARILHPGEKNDLNSLCLRYKVSIEDRILHGAIIDSLLLAQVFFKMIATYPNSEEVLEFQEDLIFPKEYNFVNGNKNIKIKTVDNVNKDLHNRMMMFLDIAPELYTLRKEHEDNLYFFDADEE